VTGLTAEQLARNAGVSVRTMREVLADMQSAGQAVRTEEGWRLDPEFAARVRDAFESIDLTHGTARL
jgi:predicted DNA-binding transcriptional regulator YafY